MKTLFLRNMDALSIKEDVVEALKKTNKIKNETKYRPAANNTKTITLTIEEAVAEELLKSKNIRIGMVECEISIQIYVKKCFKCWAHDHEIKNNIANIRMVNVYAPTEESSEESKDDFYDKTCESILKHDRL
ncbi:hypothetical protein HHI36_004236 [Cryptolaemus montrouzieri]|uniref:Uncharacterized protein n=1 Tax=Cryptolaemus montrouzieri TaxID=559131 RepID=A0ABD2NR94_9CUCU